MERELLTYDYLHVGGNAAVDLRLGQEDTILVFENKGNTILRTTPKDFFSGPGSRGIPLDQIEGASFGFEGEFLTWNLSCQIGEYFQGECHSPGVPKGRK